MFISKGKTAEDILTKKDLAFEIVNLAGFSDSLESYIPTGYFCDIDSEDYAVKYAEISVGQKFINASASNTFGVNENAVYSQVCRALLVALGYRDLSLDRDMSDWCSLAGDTGITCGISGAECCGPVSFGMFSSMVDNTVKLPLVQAVFRPDGSVMYIKREGCTVLSQYISLFQNANHSENANHLENDSLSLLKLKNSGWDIFSGNGYRYGPSMMINPDGSIDMWTATDSSGIPGEIDWGRNRRSYDGGFSWTAEAICVRPTPNTEDWCWSCDPGIIKIGEYYYAGYTSILYQDGVDNNMFLARSKTADGSYYEKWCGDGWYCAADGEKFSPRPVINFDGVQAMWGAGEPCFTVVGGTIYCYITWKTGEKTDGATRVYTAPADDPLWPGKLKYRGAAFVPYNNEDSCDVKYIDAYKCFIAVASAERFSSKSYIHLWLSYDGITFRHEQKIKTNLCDSIHNMGIAGTQDGHLDINEKSYIAYSYQPKGASWGAWPTRFVPVSWIGGYSGEIPSREKIADINEADSRKTLAVFPKQRSLPVKNKTEGVKFSVDAYSYREGGYTMYRITQNADTKYTYDESLVKIDLENEKIYLLKDTGTRVMIEYGGMASDIYVYPDYDDGSVDYLNKTSKFYAETDEIIFRYKNEKKQPGFIAVTGNLKYTMLWGKSSGVVFSGYDDSIIQIEKSTGIVTAKKSGETYITAEYENYKADVKIIVLPSAVK